EMDPSQVVARLVASGKPDTLTVPQRPTFPGLHPGPGHTLGDVHVHPLRPHHVDLCPGHPGVLLEGRRHRAGADQDEGSSRDHRVGGQDLFDGRPVHAFDHDGSGAHVGRQHEPRDQRDEPPEAQETQQASHRALGALLRDLLAPLGESRVHVHDSNPTNWISGSRSTPVSAFTFSRTSRTRAAMSSAVAPGPATTKLACFSETVTSPTLRPFRPSSSMIFPADDPSGFLKTLPALSVPPGW